MLCLSACLAVLAPPVRAQAAGGAADLVISAIALVGVPYRPGGDDPATGFDCSGLVRYAARAALGLDLPRRAEEIGRSGVDVERSQLQPGDLVFFNTLGRPFSHVGVYLGDERFVHAPSRRGQVRIEQMTQAYWRLRYDGARRLASVASDAAVFVVDAKPQQAPPQALEDDLWGRITP